MKTFKELLIELRACDSAKEWAENKTIEEIVKTCHRGDWLLWLGKSILLPLKDMTLAKGYCAKTVIHLMKDKRSRDAVKTAIQFGKGKATRKQLDNAKTAAYDAAYAAAYAADAAYAAYDAAYADAAAYAAYDAYDAAYADAAAYDAADAAASTAARKENQLATANICRKYIGKLIIIKVNKLLKTK